MAYQLNEGDIRSAAVALGALVKFTGYNTDKLRNLISGNLGFEPKMVSSKGKQICIVNWITVPPVS